VTNPIAVTKGIAVILLTVVKVVGVARISLIRNGI
jgi:hypothetical protein